jgi:LPS export ABC transporter protein LptC
MAVTGDTVENAERLRRVAVRLRAKSFQIARRHTWVVRGLRLLMPLGMASAFAVYGFLLFGSISFRAGNGKVQISKIEISDDDLKMKDVSYAGAAKDGSKYDVRAKEAAVDFAQTGPVRLDFIDGDLFQPSGIATKLKSRRGELDNKKGEMDLFDGVEIDSSNGLRARMKSAKVFNKEHRVIAKEGVIAEMPTGVIQARTMDMNTKTKAGVFAGNVAVRLTQDPAAPKTNLSLGRESRGPLDVTSQRLDLDDTTKVALFSGGVIAAQTESTLKSTSLQVFYEGKTGLPGQAAVAPNDPTQAQASRVSKLHAAGQVVINSGTDRRITAEKADFDVVADTALFVGPVVEIQQGKNRLVGRRLSVDRKSGKSRLDAPADGRNPAGRIQTTFYQTDSKGGAVKPKAAPAESDSPLNFRTDPNAPMDIQAETLDLNDAAKQAVFRGLVRAQQGDFVIQAPEVIATYTGDTGFMSGQDGDPKTPAAKNADGKSNGAQISKVDAKNKVVITSRDGQEARGEWATFDVKANTVLLGGGVTLKQGRQSTTGARLFIDLATGEARIENDPGTPVVGPALAAQAKPKSAVGPGGLPAIIPAQPIPKIVPGNASCPPGRQCLETYIDDLKAAQKQKKADAVPVVKAAKPVTPSNTPKVDGWQPATSPSPVYRAP